MKLTLTTSTKRLAALLRLVQANAHRAEGRDRLVPARRRPSLPAADLMRIPAYLRRRRLAGRMRRQHETGC